MGNTTLGIILGSYWVLSVSYCLRWHYRQGNLSYGTIFVALLIGPAIVYILIAHDYSIKKEREKLEERETNDRHRRWFQTMGLINRNAIPDYGRTIPPPPPISRVERARSERDEAIRTARERINKNKITDFKFLSGNVED